MNINQVTVVGRMARSAELKALPSGTAIADFTVATSRKWKGNDGNQQEETEWHNCVAFGRVAEIAAQYLEKGQLVGITGRLQTQSWDDKNGGAKRYKTRIVVESMQMGPKSGGATAADDDDIKPENIGKDLSTPKPGPLKAGYMSKPAAAPATKGIQYPDEDIDPDDIPF